MKKTFAPPVCIDYRAPVITSTRSARWHNFFSEKFPLKNVRHFSFSPRRATPATHTPHQIPRRKTMWFHLRKIYANELLPSGFFDDINALVPVPLHPAKLRRRGYNQSEWIARGIEQVTGIEVYTEWLYHSQNTKSQTGKNIYERWLDTRTAYETDSELDLSDKHILLVDDVVTTGATLLACAQALYLHGKPRISCLTLAAVL